MMLDITEQFKNAMITAGMTPPTQMHADGKKHRFSTNGNARDMAGEYRIYTDGIPSGYFKDYRSGIYQSWCLNMGRPYTPEETFKLQEIIKKREQQEQAEEEASALESQTIYNSAAVADENDPYLVSQDNKPVEGLRTNERGLIVPVMLDKKIMSLQFIKPDSKYFQPNGRVHGCYFPIGKSKNIICICEGLATGISIYEATQYSVLVAFSCHNLPVVAQHIRSKLPQALILICSDDDEVGLKFARQAVELIKGELVIPIFDENRPEKAKDFNDMAKLYGLDRVKNLINAACMVSKATAPRPLLYSLPPVMPFDPVTMLPPAIRDFVMDVSKRQQSPPDFIAVTALCALAAVLGNQLLICPKQNDNWTVTPNLWGAIIGRPSAMKSPTMKAALQPLYMLEKQFLSEYASEKQNNQKELTLDKLSQEVRMKKAKKNLEEGKRDEALIDLENNGSVTQPITRKRLILNDTTVEKLGELLNENPNGLILLRDELSGWLSEMQKEENQSDKAFYLECFDGNGKYTYDRIARGTIEIANCTLSIIGGIQPSKIAPLIHKAMSGIVDDGLIQRLQLAVWPDDLKKWEWIDEKPDADAAKNYEKIFHDFHNLRKQDSCLPPFLHFTPGAQDLFIDWVKEIRRIARSPNIHPALESHFLKMPQTIPSIALIIELAIGGRQAIGEEATIMALRWTYYLKTHAERLYSLGLNQAIDGARSILKQKDKLKSLFTARDISEKGWKDLTSIELVDEALQCLIDHNYLCSTKTLTTDAGGRPTTKYSWIDYGGVQ